MLATLRIYEKIGSGDAPEKLLEERTFEVASDKPLNGQRAKEYSLKPTLHCGRARQS